MYIYAKIMNTQNLTEQHVSRNYKTKEYLVLEYENKLLDKSVK